MRKVRVEDSVGMVLAHDLTKIVPGSYKGAAFRRGHVIRSEDIPELLKMGKRHVYVEDDDSGLVHEDEAATILAGIVAGPGVELSTPSEGRVNIRASEPGLFVVSKELVNAVNGIEGIVLATARPNRVVDAGELLGGARVVPVAVPGELLGEVEKAVAGVLANSSRRTYKLSVLPLRALRTAIITTGSEVYTGLIEDKFAPIVKSKLESYNCPVVVEIATPDDPEVIKEEILKCVANGAELVLITGGMSVDPDDVTPGGIKRTGAEVIAYGVPALPGSMFMLAYLGQVAIMGLPGCVMHDKVTVFDIVLPRVLTGERLTRQDFVELGYGGLCMKCATCVFPRCAFGAA